MTRTFAAVDLGAQSGRVAAGRLDGESLVVDEVHRFLNKPVHDRGVLRWDIGRLEEDVQAGLGTLGRDYDVTSVAVDSWAVDFGLIDASGRLLHDPVHYRDSRRAAAFEDVLERIPARELYARTGIQLLPINTLFELAAMASSSDGSLARARRLLLIPDLFHHWLCGSESTERTNATTTQCYDVQADEWAWELLDQIGFPVGLLPEVVPSGTEIGRVSGTVRDSTGLRETKVIAGATHDTAAAVAAVPLSTGRSAFLSVGTWSLVGVESDRPVITDESFAANLTNEGGVDGTYRLLRNITGLWLLHECRRVWADAGRVYEYAELVDLARAAEPFHALIDPNDPSFLDPGDMPVRIAAYLADTDQDAPTSDAGFVRCILESLALKHAETLDLIETVTNRPIEELHVVGGGASNDLLCAWTAHASNRPVMAGPVEATLIGNVLLQARAAGEISSLAEGRELVRLSFPPVFHEPMHTASWQEARERFAALAPRRRELEVRA